MQVPSRASLLISACSLSLRTAESPPVSGGGRKRIFVVGDAFLGRSTSNPPLLDRSTSTCPHLLPSCPTQSAREEVHLLLQAPRACQGSIHSEGAATAEVVRAPKVAKAHRRLLLLGLRSDRDRQSRMRISIWTRNRRRGWSRCLDSCMKAGVKCSRMT